MSVSELTEVLANAAELHKIRFFETKAVCICKAWETPVLDIRKVADLEAYFHQQHVAQVMATLAYDYFGKETSK